MLFTKEDYGKIIKKDISDLLRRYVGTADFARAAEVASERFKKVSPSTVRDVTFGSNTFTANNIKAMNILAEIAFNKSNNTEVQAQYDHQYLAKKGVSPSVTTALDSEPDHELETINR